MTRIIQAKYKKDLRYNANIWGHSKSPINKKQCPPGMHKNPIIPKNSNYKIQLEARQRIKTYYNITEKQFRNLYRKSHANFINLLERRLMTIVFRLGIVNSIFSARQLVSHKHILVNDKKLNIPSYIVQNKDKVKLSDRAREFLNIDNLDNIIPPAYIEYDTKDKSFSFIRDAEIEDIPFSFHVEAQNIIEWYSRLV